LNAMEEMDIPAFKVFLNNICFVLVMRGDSYFMSLESELLSAEKVCLECRSILLISKKAINEVTEPTVIWLHRSRKILRI